jgi:hypothetical protein
MAVATCRDRPSDDSFVPPPTPAALRGGAQAFARHCARCHGQWAAGTDSGPPLAHEFYGPAHHADVTFELAIRRGVVAHHWRFGDMPPQPQVADSEIVPITDFVRWLQRERAKRQGDRAKGS